MITLTVRFPDEGEIVYTVNRPIREITGNDEPDLLIMLVEEALESDGFIGPQVDEFVGAWGNWGHPINVVAAFIDAAEAFGASVTQWDMSDSERNVAAALAAAEADVDDEPEFDDTEPVDPEFDDVEMDGYQR